MNTKKFSSVIVANEILSHCVSGGLERLPAEIVLPLSGVRQDANAFEGVRNIAHLTKDEKDAHFQIAREKNIKKISDKLEEYAEGDEVRLQNILKCFSLLCEKAKKIKEEREKARAKNIEATKSWLSEIGAA